mmetsp:Transcript_990/g.1544  ORF Transcript_990/g.1544 Transcript_990/m.1544 type:complete len:346 (+) Transcript_990:1219-2256(+)
MDIAKPSRFPCHWMGNNRGLPWSTSLQHFCIVVSTFSPEHFDIEVYLGVDSSRNQALDSSHQRTLQGFWEVIDPAKEGKFHDRVTNVAIVEFFDQIRVQVLEHATSIGNQEFSTSFSGLETDKCGRSRSSGSNKFVVHTNKEVLSALLVDGFVHWRIFLAISSGTSRHGLQRILADFHSQSVVKFLESVLRLHEIKPTEHNGAVIFHLFLEFHGILLEVCELRFRVVAGDADIGGRDFGSKFWQFLFSEFLLELADILNLVTPSRQGGGWGFDGRGFQWSIRTNRIVAYLLLDKGLSGRCKAPKQETHYCSSRIHNADCLTFYVALRCDAMRCVLCVRKVFDSTS